jgi:glyceraldehyde 3-phosphate dehydrogenase
MYYMGINKQNILINGLGRVGKSLLRNILEHDNLFATITLNATATKEQLIHMIKYDSLSPSLACNCSYDEQYIYIGRHRIKTSNTKNLEDLDLKGIDIVFECTGSFNSKEKLSPYIKAGVKRVVVSAPCDGADKTIIFGVNHTSIEDRDVIISAGSCTTNCLAPICDVLHNNISIEKAYMTTIHSYTNDQRILDGNHSDIRRSRACGLSIIPTSTGAAKTITQIIPALKGKIEASALRVPTPNVSLIDLSFVAARDTNIEELNSLFRLAAKNKYRNIIDIAADRLVSIDFNHNRHSAIIDPFETRVVDGNFVRILAWYDNENAFAARMIDIAKWFYNAA